MTREVFKVSAWGLLIFALIQFYANLGQWQPPAVTVLPDTVLDLSTPVVAWDAPTTRTRWAVGPPIQPIQEVGE